MVFHWFRFVFCGLCLLFFSAFPVSASENKEWRTDKTRYARLMHSDPVFAESEKNLLRQNNNFWPVSATKPARWRNSCCFRIMAALLREEAGYFYLARNPEEITGKELAKSRQDILRYMKLVKETPYEDPAFSLLHLPVAHALTVPQGQPNDLPLLVWEVLAVYDMYRVCLR